MLRTLRCPYRLENCLISRQRGRSTKRRMFIVSDRADGYFVSFPLEWDCEVLLRKMFGKTWVWRLVN